MKRFIKQVVESIAVLILLLMIPLVVENTIGKKNQNLHASISAQAATTASAQEEIKEISTPFTITNAGKTDYAKLGLYTLAVLFIISVISFFRFKIIKDLHDQK
jgi:hypothetical protein